jgi:hypothetical protein
VKNGVGYQEIDLFKIQGVDFRFVIISQAKQKQLLKVGKLYSVIVV